MSGFSVINIYKCLIIFIVEERYGENMKLKDIIFPFFKQRWWYIVLLVSSTIYILHNRNNIKQLKEFNATNLIFILWLVLLLLPLFSEMEFFGIKLKKEVEKAKDEIKENISDIRLQIMELKVSNSNANTINFGNEFLPTEQKLKDLGKEFLKNSSTSIENSSEVKSTLKFDISTVSEDVSNINFDIAEESIYLFKIRLFLEKTLTDLCEKTGYNEHKSTSGMLKHLNRCEIINGKTAELINQIVKIANRGVHGEIISNEYINFINQVLPELLKQLKEVNSKLYYYVCPRCKSAGYSRFENICPSCGFTSDD